MTTCHEGEPRPPLHLLASESDLVAGLALRAEQRDPVVSAMLLGEIERAELHDPHEMPGGYVGFNSQVTFRDERTGQMRTMELVVPANANTAEGRISILTPMGAALYGLAEGACIDWPDLEGNLRSIRVVRVERLMLDPGTAASRSVR